MKLRQAKKIMKNVRLYTGMIWVYGPGRVDKANDRMCKYYARSDEGDLNLSLGKFRNREVQKGKPAPAGTQIGVYETPGRGPASKPGSVGKTATGKERCCPMKESVTLYPPLKGVQRSGVIKTSR
mgnify:CR=1 FL=1